MRKALAAALPLAVLLDASAHAATTISSSQSTPVATSTAGDINIESGGGVSPSTTTPAVTVDSDNAVNNAGTIGSKDVNDAVGVLLTGGHTGSLINTGTISQTESYAATDSANADAITEAPYASGSGRYGIRLTGAAPFTGAITNTGSIAVNGNGSYAVSLEAPLAGALTSSGAVTLTGDSGVALRELAGITGPVTLSGTVSSKGQASSAADLEGDIGGRLSIYGAISSTGYGSTTRPTTAASLTAIQATPADLQQGGSAMILGGSVAGGVFIGAPPAGTVAGTTADVDGDGVADSSEATGSITTYGSAPALVIGAANKAITLGAVGGSDLENTAQPANAYGLINRGTISGLGIYDGVSATGMQIGGFSGGSASLAGGLRNVGTISATAYSADATGMVVGSGAVIPELRNEGLLEGVITASTGANTATALSIGPGPTVTSLTNFGTILGAATGDTASAVAVADRSGSISSVLNEGTIAATITPTVLGDATSGTRTALDLRANTTGVTLVQQTTPYVGVVYGSTSATADVATSTATAVTPSITGDVYLGTGNDTVRLLAGTMTGVLDFKTGADTFLIDNGASYSGDLRYAGAGLTLNVANGSLRTTNASTLNLTSLNVGSASTLTVAIDPANGAATRFMVAGPATFASGSTIGFITKSLLTGPKSYTLVTSPSLSYAGSATALSDAPYLLVSSLAADTTAGTLTLDVRRRTAAEIGMNAGETAAFDPVYSALGRDTSVQAAVFASIDRTSFLRLYDRLLPDYAGGVFDLIDQAARQVSDAALATDVKRPEAGRFWTQEFVLGAKRDAAEAGAYTTNGFGVSGGIEGPQGPLGALGVDVAWFTGQARSIASNRVDVYGFQGGLYWRAVFGGLQLGARGSAGYDWFEGERDFNGVDASGTAFTRAAKASWNGFQASGRASAAYALELGRFYLRPQVHADYVMLDEDKYTEVGGGDAMDLAVASRSGHEFSGVASAAVGWNFGSGAYRWRPELEAGVRDVFEGTAGTTTAQFVSGGDSFSLLPSSIKGAGLVAKGSMNVESDMVRLGLEASAEDLKGREAGAVLVRVRAAF